jgi:predicted dehydrogenase
MSTAAINAALLAGAREADGVEVVAVASRDRETAQRYARVHGIERAHGGYDALLADPAVEVVYVSLPNSLHLESTSRALAAGKHVLCEKPLGRRAGAVEQAFELAERHGLVLMGAFMLRHHPQTKRLAELVAGGAIGRLPAILAAFCISVEDPANVRLHAGLDGGALMDVGCYCVSGARLLTGEPERASAARCSAATGSTSRSPRRCASPETSSRTSTPPWRARPATGSRWSVTRGRWRWRIRGCARRP